MITIIIPSLNEEKNIGILTEIIDRGLSKYYPDQKCVIVNVDSNSDDNTIRNFLSSKTLHKKISLKCPDDRRGKGLGLHIGMNYFALKNHDVYVTIDADVKTVTPVWIQRFVEPIVSKIYDLAIPIYTRNRYEGNTTNHFVSPIVYSLFGIDILQPIAGDFGISSRLTKDVIKNFEMPSDDRYGVDILITFTALINEYKIRQVYLNRKIHNPSFGKIEHMFFDCALTTFYLINKYREHILKTIKNKGRKKLTGKFQNVIDKKYNIKPATAKIKKTFSIAKTHLKNYKKINSRLDRHIKTIRECHYTINSSLWVDFLSDYLIILLIRHFDKAEIECLAKNILPIYLMRTITYMKDIESEHCSSVNYLIQSQKENVGTLLLQKLEKRI